MKSFSWVFSVIGVVALTTTGGSGFAQEGSPRTICLGSPLDCVQNLVGGVNVRTRICRLRVKLQCDDGSVATALGTGALVDCGDGKKHNVLTAKHVVKGTGFPEFCNGLGYDAIEILADFGYYHTGSPCVPTSACGAIAETRRGSCIQSDPTCDVAIIRLDREVTTVVDAPLQLSTDPEPNDTVNLYIPQHPLGDCMEMAEGKVHHYGAGASCDVFMNISATQASSGSPIIRKSDGKIVGIQTAEQEDCPNIGVRLDKLKTIVPDLCARFRVGERGGDFDEFCIPTLSEWGLIVMTLLLLLVGGTTVFFRKRGSRAAAA